jgi:hypothetical protein
MALIAVKHPIDPAFFILINKDSFDPDTHELWEDEDPDSDAGTTEPPSETTGDPSGESGESQPEGEPDPNAPEGESDPANDRLNELMAIFENDGWPAIKEIATSLGINDKPAGGWEDAIPLIVEAEQQQQ